MHNLMYVKEDIILPQSITFYDLIVNKAQGKSGPLFQFDLQEHAAASFDPRMKSQDSHAGGSRSGCGHADAVGWGREVEGGGGGHERGSCGWCCGGTWSEEPSTLPARLPACPPARSSLPPPAPAAGKVVDRHWYNKNKHIYPASRWEAFDEAKQYEKDGDDPLPDLR